MRLRALIPLNFFAGGAYAPGEEWDHDDDADAGRLIAAAFAEAVGERVTATPGERPVETATRRAPERRRKG